MKKKIVTISVALIVSILVGCSAKQTEPTPESEPTVEQTVQDQSVTETTPEQTPPAESIPEQPESTDPVESVPEQPEQTPPTEPAPEKPVETQTADLFTDVNETVYATGTVNLRSGAGTSYDKVGQLSWGNQVQRIGIGTGEAEGWSEVQLGDGRVVYVSSKYLSTTKPVAQQSSGGQQSSNNSGSQNNNSGGSGSQNNNSGSSGGFKPGAGCIDPTKDNTDWSQYEGGTGYSKTPEESEQAWAGIG